MAISETKYKKCETMQSVHMISNPGQLKKGLCPRCSNSSGIIPTGPSWHWRS